ncbi:hypothetical protein [Lentibacillus sp. CBA3610]|nr:hypothetical protein [Lentibacillus sp. CBA3610]
MYLFDYDWRFVVIIDSIQEGDEEPVIPYIQESVGDGPDQYFFIGDI